MKHVLLGVAALSLGIGSAVDAQTTEPLVPETETVTVPVAPPAVVATPVAPDAFVVTPVPGVVASTKVKVQKFGDYDIDDNGVYHPMEFAQAMYFLATSDPVAGNPKLPTWDRYVHKGAPAKLSPKDAVTLLNASADEFAIVDMNNDWRVTPQELSTYAML